MRSLANLSKVQSEASPILTETIPNDTLTFTLGAEVTQALTEPKYNYDVQITHTDGTVDTFISSVMQMIDEVE